jgi:heme-binding NEAT domain protein
VVDLPNVSQAFEQFTNGQTHIGVKKMGVLDNKVFANACRNIQSQEDAQVKAATLCSEWEKELRNPEWHPFMVVEDGDKYTVCIL